MRIQIKNPQPQPPQNPSQSTENTQNQGDDDPENQENQENVENVEEVYEEEGEADVPVCHLKPKPSMKQLCHEWNWTEWIGYTSETTKGWLKKTKDLRMFQGHALRWARPGTQALQEIRHY